MTQASLEQEILTHLHKLAPAQQRQVLVFVRTLASVAPVGVPGHELLPFAGAVEKAELDAMAQAIEDGCEQVNPDEW